MTKHGRNEESFEDFPLQHSIKKMKIGGEMQISAQEVTSNLNSHFEQNETAGSTLENHMRKMNQLLGSLHFLRLGRKAERERAVSATPDTFHNSYSSSQQSHDTDVHMDIS